MKYLLSILLLFSFNICFSQQSKISEEPKFPETDTVKCLFLEVLNMDSASVKWTAGYIRRENGFIDFWSGMTAFNSDDHFLRVLPSYLPVTEGIVASPLFYNDMSAVKNKAIKIIIKP